jgi:hypothetical protein
MPSIPGKITKRLLAMFGPNDPGWNPERPAAKAPKRSTKLPKGVQGHSVGRGANRNAGK